MTANSTEADTELGASSRRRRKRREVQGDRGGVVVGQTDRQMGGKMAKEVMKQEAGRKKGTDKEINTGRENTHPECSLILKFVLVGAISERKWPPPTRT